jgi:hypothetical protein
MSEAGGMMQKSNLIDMSGLSGDPSEDERLERLFFRLELPTPVSHNVISVVFEPGELRGYWEKASDGSSDPDNDDS